MIDVSSLNDLQAAVVLLIERRGNEGRRVCELCKERKKNNKRSITRVLSELIAMGVIIKIDGDTVRYYSPMGTPTSVSPPVSPRKTPLKNQIHDSNKQTKKKREFVKEELQAEAKTADSRPQTAEEEGKLTTTPAIPTPAVCRPPSAVSPAPAAPLPSETPSQARKASRRNHLLINTAAERKANRTSRIAAEAVLSREYVNGTDNGYKVDTYWHPHDPDFPVTLRIPIVQPKKGDFDGRIYAAALDRERTLDRMIYMIGLDKEWQGDDRHFGACVVRWRVQLGNRNLGVAD